MHPTQRRLMIALIVTLACLPLLVLDMLQGSSTSSATETASSSDSSLVVASVASVDETTTTTVAVTVPDTVAAPVTTVAPPVTVAPRSVQTTTTTAPRPVVTAPPAVQSEAAFLACVRHRESRNNYSASDPTGTFLGAYQIYQGGWDAVAARVGRLDLVGVPPNQASPSDQDDIALAMYQFYGRAPWGGSCG